jgi:hypothetical protein
VWLRGLIKPPPGYAIAYIDWKQQEFGIAAALSGDTAMQAAYRSGDSYLAFAKQASLAPPGATKDTHRGQRELCKQCVLGVIFGMKEIGLACASISRASLLVVCCRHTRKPIQYLGGGRTLPSITPCSPARCTPCSDGMCVGENPNPRSLRNFVCQANGAEMMGSPHA